MHFLEKNNDIKTTKLKKNLAYEKFCNRMDEIFIEKMDEQEDSLESNKKILEKFLAEHKGKDIFIVDKVLENYPCANEVSLFRDLMTFDIMDCYHLGRPMLVLDPRAARYMPDVLEYLLGTSATARFPICYATGWFYDY